jgi:hypothetical protein
MQRPLDLLDQVRNVVQGKARPEIPEIARHNLEGLPRGGDATGLQHTPQRLIDDVSEGSASAARFRLSSAATSPSKVSVVRMPCCYAPRHHGVNVQASHAYARIAASRTILSITNRIDGERCSLDTPHFS